MLDKVDLVRAIGIPQINDEHIKGCVDFTRSHGQGQKREAREWHGCSNILDINFLLGVFISYDKSNTWWRSDRSSILERDIRVSRGGYRRHS